MISGPPSAGALERPLDCQDILGVDSGYGSRVVRKRLVPVWMEGKSTIVSQTRERAHARVAVAFDRQTGWSSE